MTVNFAFRAWHDWCHWIGAHPFTPEGEAAVYAMQCRQLIIDYATNPDLESWCKIIEAEIIGQGTFERIHKRFPHDQHRFVEAYLKSPKSALLWSSW